MDPGKVSAIIDWLSPRNMFEAHSFKGLASFYQFFIKKKINGIFTP